jgi:protein TonB
LYLSTAISYPPVARRLEKQGAVLLRVTIDTHGRPIKVEVVKRVGFGMDEAALKAVEESTFIPARRNGQSLTSRALLPIRFVLEIS